MNFPYIPEQEYSVPKHHIFVYGTLKSGFGNNNVLINKSTSELVGVKQTAYPEWGMCSYSNTVFPFLYRKKTEGSYVEGEHWIVDDLSYLYIRELEIGAGYEEEPITLDGGTEVLGYVYPVQDIPIPMYGIDFIPNKDNKLSWPLVEGDEYYDYTLAETD